MLPRSTLFHSSCLQSLIRAGSQSRAVSAGVTGVSILRTLSTLREKLAHCLKTSEAVSLLREGGVDTHDAFEREEMLRRLETALPSLPPAARTRLDHLLQEREGTGGRSGARPSAGAGAGAGAGATWVCPGDAPNDAHAPGQREAPSAATAMTPAAAASVAKGTDTAAAAAAAGGIVGGGGLFSDESRVVSLYQRCRPSVVHIACVGAGGGGPPALLDPKAVPRNFGSGFVWDRAEHVVTNYHVIRAATAARVTLANNRRCGAVLRGAEPDKDLAVLKINAPPAELVPVEVGVSSRLVVGQAVYAIGNPFGLDHTLTAGIVSGLGREMHSITGHLIRDVVQTDASINPGNSGGPLLDSHGRLVGVNTAATSHPNTTAGFGFAIPSDTVRRIVNQLIKYGRVVRPSLGVMVMHDVHSRQLLGAGAYGAGEMEGVHGGGGGGGGGGAGVVVAGVVPGSGAERAGVRGVRRDAFGSVVVGDVVVGVGGVRVGSVEELLAVVEHFSVGDTVPLTLHRYEGRGPLDRAFTRVEVAVPLLSEAGGQGGQGGQGRGPGLGVGVGGRQEPGSGWS